jgi:hypothetical protein
MANFKKNLKNKFKNQKDVFGKVSISPPASQTVLQGSSSLTVLDLLAEGPIEGLVTQEGKYAKGLKFMESIYLDNTPVKEPEASSIVAKPIKMKMCRDNAGFPSIRRFTATGIDFDIDELRGALDQRKSTAASSNAGQQAMVPLYQKQLDDLAAFRTAIATYIQEHSGLARFGYIAYRTHVDTTDGNDFALFKHADDISGRVSRHTVNGNQVPYLTTVYDFSAFLKETVRTPDGTKEIFKPYKRQIKDPLDDNTYSIPEDMHFLVPVFSGMDATNSGEDQGITGQIGNRFRLSGFNGGGFIFFEIGTGLWNTDKTFLERNQSNITYTNFQNQVQQSFDDGYDIFTTGNGAYNANFDDGNIYLHQATKNQISPTVGEVNGLELNLGFVSDLESKYNFNNVSVSFRQGYEQQPVMEGYQSGVQDFQIKKTLLGPLIFRPGAGDSFGTGFSDIRSEDGAGDYSAWMTNPPIQHDAYPYNHIIRRPEVTACYPTIAINSLFDTAEAGDNVGQQRAATLRMKVEYGFEGDIGEPTSYDAASETRVGQLLTGGNTLGQIALAQFKKNLIKDYTSLISNTYLDTINELDNLPLNESLKNLKVSADDVPGLTLQQVNDFGYTSGELLFPGESWKDINRYCKVTKVSAETQSQLIRRSVDISYYTEIIDLPFSYPFAAICGTTFDARSFFRQPSRQWDVRLKKVLVPSNYNILDGEGKDKRFVADASIYGRRNIYKFNGSNNYFEAKRDILLGERNFEIKAKVKFGSIITNSDYQYIIDTDGGTTTANRITIHQTNGNIVFFGRESDGSAIGGANFDISSYSASHLFEVSIKRRGSKLLFNVTANGTALTEQTHTLTNGLNLNFDVSADRALLIGINANESTGTVLEANSQVVDLRFYRDGQIIHWYDGTVIDTAEFDTDYLTDNKVFKDKIGGAHALLGGTYNAVETDTNFFFGKNKEVIYNGEWDGSFKLAWTDNPAWILYDLMINPTYGIGNSIDDRQDINIFRLYDLARFCDAVDEDGLFDGVSDATFGLEPRFSANIKLGTPKNAFEVLGNIASIFRAITFWDGAALNFQIDRPKDISAIFNNQNVYDGMFNYGDILSSARYTRVEVPYSDAKDQFTIKFEYVEDEERIRQYGVVVNKINGIGCTSRSQARRIGKYVLLSNKMETELVNFKAGPEALFLEPGDIFQINDDIKQFELSYGEVQQIISGTDGSSNLTGSIIVNGDINTGSVEIGGNGGLYVYNNKKQNTVKDLYDIYNLDKAETFGLEDENVYTGVIPFEVITGNSDTKQISKFQVSSIIGVNDGTQANLFKLSLDHTQPNFSDFTGIHTGSYFNLELNNREPKTYKLVKIIEEDKNLYEIHGMQYDVKKFALTEADDFDVDQNTYNIGIPNNVINRPLAPTVVSESFFAESRNISITGEATRAAGSNETKYKIVVLNESRSGPYYEKDVLAEETVTPFRIDNITNAKDSTLSLRVIAMRNPDSVGGTSNVNILRTTANPVVYNTSLFKNISTQTGNSFHRTGEKGYGTGSCLTKDCEYYLNIVDNRDYDVTINSHPEYFVNVYLKDGEDYNLIKEHHKDNSYTFTEVANRTNHEGNLSNNFELRFDLYTGTTSQSGDIADTSYYNTTII